jgi:hypothetical protein
MAAKVESESSGQVSKKGPPKKKVSKPDTMCGIVMPLSPMDGYPADHWPDVQEILTDAIESAGFSANVVSEAQDVGIIQKRIIHNLYENPIVVCDVSGKNPNVMFELGLRLAFDKPTIIVKDEKTSYSFDTAPIEHVPYPSDLRFGRIVDFKDQLALKIRATYEKSISDKNYTTFLKHFGTFRVAKLDTREVSKEDFILEELKNLRQFVTAAAQVPSQGTLQPSGSNKTLVLCLRNTAHEKTRQLAAEIEKQWPGGVLAVQQRGRGHYHIVPDWRIPLDRGVILALSKKMDRTARWISQIVRF